MKKQLLALNNSFDAVENLNEKWIKVDITKVGSCMCIKVVDSGKGIDKTIIEQLTQPFFTTKEAGKGTGLGLSISKRIVKDHGGNLLYGENENTAFLVQIPMTGDKTCKIEGYLQI